MVADVKAGGGNRTRISRVETSRSTIELRPRSLHGSRIGAAKSPSIAYAARVIRPLLALAVTAACGLGAAAATSGAPVVFPYGVAAGEITPTSAVLWTRLPKAGKFTFDVEQVTPKPRARTDSSVFGGGGTLAERDNTISVRLGGAARLRPDTVYRYRFSQGQTASPWGTFRTAPKPTSAQPIRFAISGDADATAGPSGRPFFNNYETYAAMAAERNHFNLNVGDTIYSDSEVGGVKPALTVAEKWGKYKLGLSLAPLRRVRAATGLYSHWDDHEFINDFTKAEHGQEIYDAGRQAFTDYAPVTYRAATGLYRTFRWGRHLELFFLDERSFRSGKVATACGGDLAPTAPVAVRQAFAALAPALANPVPAGCLEALNDPARTMLGAQQEAAFAKALRASTATFKVIVNEVPLLQLYALPYDRWEGYGAARARFIETLAGVKNVVVLTTDTHAHLIGEVRTQTLEGPQPVGTGIFEVVTGPVATNTYQREIDSFLGAAGTGAFINALFFKPAPPRGLGLTCANTDQFGYSEVSVTATRLTVTPKTDRGVPVKDSTGAACGPLVLTAG